MWVCTMKNKGSKTYQEIEKKQREKETGFYLEILLYLFVFVVVIVLFFYPNFFNAVLKYLSD